MADTLETVDRDDNGIPPEWGYNPAAWSQRLPIIALALLGGIVAFYLTLFQWGVVRTIWEPFFSGGEQYPNGSVKILTSPTSEFFPRPFTDAFLGFLGYVGDAVFGAVGGTRRWRTMPWVVIVFGILVGPLGAVSIGLVITQPLAYDTFCTLCIVTAIISVLMIGPAMDEMLASLQYMRRVRDHGRPFWRYFWGRGQQEPLPESPVQRAPIEPWHKRLQKFGMASQAAAALVGCYLLAAPDLWGYGGAALNVERFIGPLVASLGVMCTAEVLRNLRWVNVALGVMLILLAISPWPSYPRSAILNSVICGGLVIALSCVPFPRVTRFGGGWKRAWWSPSPAT